nr:helix-turn-helix domain-containing protein [Mycobacterium sp. GA-2829]
MARQLCDFAARFGTDVGGRATVPNLSTAELADLVGSPEPVVIDALNDFQRRHWVEVRSGTAVPVDPEQLARAVGTPQ